MQESLETILVIQEVDIKMIRLIRVKKERQQELAKIQALNEESRRQVVEKEAQVLELKKEIRMGETHIKEIQERVIKLEAQQAAVRKMDEFNALTQEMTQTGRDKNATEHKLSDLMDRMAQEEDLLVSLRETLQKTEENSRQVEQEIKESIAQINAEGRLLLEEREKSISLADPEIFRVYERLLKNKKDRVVVPIENRTCSGCHIVLTPQHENMVRKGDRLVFCEHCSRILYWQEVAPVVTGEEGTTRRRRRRAAATAS